MGNCLFGGSGPDADHHGSGTGGGLTTVITSNGGVMEFFAPISVGSITDEFPGHGVFRMHDLFLKPLPYHEYLAGGEPYYLLPLSGHAHVVKEGHVLSNTVTAPTVVTPYRVSMEHRLPGALSRSYTDVLSLGQRRRPRSGVNGVSGVWKVRLVINPENLMDILSHDGRTQELVESMRAVAKCGAGGGPVGAPTPSSWGLSDPYEWSGSSSLNASDKTDRVVANNT
ncbi:hypothetical protein SAY86_000495 [Trapa natans]|uniref:Uncharacterized protein n=1 Tax=Trapa natans TaxID=22666 RepID=A0AAN7RFQ6_TRANT|nr:hypothetical protein SAY86_000495 [Trapa natans]